MCTKQVLSYTFKTSVHMDLIAIAPLSNAVHAIFKTTILLSSEVSPAPGLEVDDDLSQLDVSLLLELGQDTGSEEHLGVSDTVGGRV